MDGVWIPIILFVVVGFCVSLALYFRFRSRQELQLTVRSTIDSGQGLSAETLSELSRAMFPPRSDLRRGLILCAVGAAVIAFAFGVGEADAVGPLLGLSAFPFAVGIAYLVLWRFVNNEDGGKA